jgi:hypothetical protein
MALDKQIHHGIIMHKVRLIDEYPAQQIKACFSGVRNEKSYNFMPVICAVKPVVRDNRLVHADYTQQ